MKKPIHVFWFRRDLRLNDNTALYHALNSGKPVLPIFIFDPEILKELPEKDARVTFIYALLNQINQKLEKQGSQLLIKQGKPLSVFKDLIQEFEIAAVYTNRDYEPYAIQRDQEVKNFLESKHISFHEFKDQVIFEKAEVVKQDGSPYTVYTPYSKIWLQKFKEKKIESYPSEDHLDKLLKAEFGPRLNLKDLGFKQSEITVPGFDISKNLIENYSKTRDVPSMEGTSRLGPHLRFGTVSIRELARKAANYEETFLKELIWREFFMQILYHFPHVVDQSFKPAYDKIEWLNDETQFKKWCEGKTGYPMVDAGMRQLNQTGYMHNRVRMVVASFLCKHLLIDWRWGEAYFAEKLLDFELSSNNGNWQWAAGTGCDAAPYFRVFNPASQQEKFDPDWKYIKKWVPEFGTHQYPEPIVDHKFARERAIKTYKQALS
ncbi:MAG TPA: deoxyribodipyrimidine photo-lyase [Bacteroidales bacterium]|nr:deoxyribodipyrimidine photo-lyase [Bacteroidales bacterium]